MSWDWMRIFRVWSSLPDAPDPAIEERKVQEIEDAKVRVRMLDLQADLIVAQYRGKSRGAVDSRPAK